MLRVLVSRQYGRGSNPGGDATCGSNLLLVLVPTLALSKFLFDLETGDEEPLRGYTSVDSYLFIHLFIYLFLFRFYLVSSRKISCMSKFVLMLKSSLKSDNFNIVLINIRRILVI